MNGCITNLSENILKQLGMIGNGWEYPTYVLQLGAFLTEFFCSRKNNTNSSNNKFVYVFRILQDHFGTGSGYIDADEKLV